MAYKSTTDLLRDTSTLISDSGNAIAGTIRLQNHGNHPVLIQATASTAAVTDWVGAIQLLSNDPIKGTMDDLFPGHSGAVYLHAISYSLPGRVSISHV